MRSGENVTKSTATKNSPFKCEQTIYMESFSNLSLIWTSFSNPLLSGRYTDMPTSYWLLSSENAIPNHSHASIGEGHYYDYGYRIDTVANRKPVYTYAHHL